MRLNHVAALSFDLDDTLWSFGVTVKRAEDALHAWLLEHAPGTASVLPSRMALAELRNEYERSRPDLAGDFRALRLGSIDLALSLAKEDPLLAAHAYDVFFAARQQVEFFEDVMPALAWLSARFPLVAVTNGNADLRLTGGSEFFRATLSAAVVGIAKPHEEIFHRAAREAGVAPETMLHVGDDFRLDVLGALDAGLQAAWLVRENVTSAHALVDASSPAATRPYVTLNELRTLCRMLGAPPSLA
ncbi:HAD-IA family hydrolase [Paraburkholderia acidisoli]|uniref:HAD-IA family hydrolase n=1 Tax=Paraburkholderia acidisoli TaxID=2571748 RepID=A0A7Z2JH02_9BURK|nr:HAD-IA family hydrolase [Paraburkholderia acidisoli]QGZ64296.1 HAD-IA family hydrolase [Paraburkholderia acidisoli]